GRGRRRGRRRRRTPGRARRGRRARAAGPALLRHPDRLAAALVAPARPAAAEVVEALVEAALELPAARDTGPRAGVDAAVPEPALRRSPREVLPEALPAAARGAPAERPQLLPVAAGELLAACDAGLRA